MITSLTIFFLIILPTPNKDRHQQFCILQILVIKQGQQIHLHSASHFHTLRFSFSHRHALLVSVRTERDHQSCCPANGELCVCHSEVNHSQLWVVLRSVLRASRSKHPSHQSPGPGTASPAYTSSGLRYRAVIYS